MPEAKGFHIPSVRRRLGESVENGLRGVCGRRCVALPRKLALKNLKVFVRANNPFIISNFDLWDVELGNNGFNYPIQKTYSVGLNVNF